MSSCHDADTTPVIVVDDDDALAEAELLHPPAPARQPGVYYFGFDLRSSPQEDAAQYLPFLRYLEEATGLRFKLHFAANSSATSDDLGLDRTQFAAMGAVSFLRANDQYGAISIARGLNEKNKATYRSVFAVSPESPLTEISQLRGRRLAFGSSDSTQGHLIPRIELRQNAISLDELDSYFFTNSHESAAEAVVSGRADAAALQDTLAERLASEGRIKIIHYSDEYPSSSIVANASVPEDVIQLVTQALIAFDPSGDHGENLYNWDRTEMPNGFQRSTYEDYRELHEWLVELDLWQQLREQAD